MQEPLTLLHNPSVQFGEQLYMQFGPYVPLLHAIKNILQFIFLQLKNLYNVLNVCVTDTFMFYVNMHTFATKNI